MLSTNWDPNDVVKVQRKKDGKIIDVDCPKVIQMYNQHMGGVDRGNQYRQYYELRTKSRKVYKYIFWFMIQVCMLNAFILTNLYQVPATTPPLQRCQSWASKMANRRLLRKKKAWKAKSTAGETWYLTWPERPDLREIHAPTLKKPNLKHFLKKIKFGRCT